MTRNIFWNHAEDRLRSGWRILVQSVLLIVPLMLAASMGVFSSGKLYAARIVIVALPSTIVSIFLVGRYIDKRNYSDYGIQIKQKAWWLDYGFGILAGFLSAGAYVVLLWFIGWADIKLSGYWEPRAIPLVIAFLVPLLTYAGIGVFEELVRTYQIKNIAEGLVGTRLKAVTAMLVAVGLAALGSVVMHSASNEPAFLVYIMISGLIYGLFFLWTRRAALAMGMHFAWDFSVSNIFVLGGASSLEPALFSVPLTQVPGFDANILLLLGIIPKVFGFLAVAIWIKRRAGEIQLNEEITRPSLINRDLHVRANEPSLKHGHPRQTV